MMKAMLSRRAVQILGILLSIGAVVLLLGSIDVEHTWQAMLGADARLLLLGALLVTGQLVVVTTRWGVLVSGVAERRLGVRRLIGPVLLGYLGNFVLPSRLGEVIRSFAVSRREEIPMSTVLGTVVLERLVDASVLALIALAAALFLGAPDWVVNVTAVAALAGILAIAFLATPGAAAIGRWLGRRQFPGAAAGSAAIRRFAGGASVRRRPVVLLAAVGLSGVSWLFEGAVYWLAAESLSLDVSLAVAFLVAAVTVLATAVPSAPAYVGTFELAVTAVATAFGVPPEGALAWALLAHVVTVAPLAVGGLISLVASGQRAADLVDAAEHAELAASLDPGAAD